MKIEIELSDEDIKNMDNLANSLAKKIIYMRAGMSDITVIDKMAGKVFDAYNRTKKEGKP